MTDIVSGILGTACIFSMSFILCKACNIRSDIKDVSSEYILIKKDHYNSLKEEIKMKQNEGIINESPLPLYSEHAPLLSTINFDEYYSELVHAPNSRAQPNAYAQPNVYAQSNTYTPPNYII